MTINFPSRNSVQDLRKQLRDVFENISSKICKENKFLLWSLEIIKSVTVDISFLFLFMILNREILKFCQISHEIARQ